MIWYPGQPARSAGTTWFETDVAGAGVNDGPFGALWRRCAVGGVVGVARAVAIEAGSVPICVDVEPEPVVHGA